MVRTLPALALALVLASVALAGCTQPGAPPGGGPGGSGAASVKTTCGGGAANATFHPGLAAPAPPTATAAPGIEAPQARQASSELVIGTMMPLTGALSAFGPDGQKAVDLAVEEINAAGGVNGRPVKTVHQDDKSTDTAGAPQTFQSLVAAGADAVVGSYASSVTGAILEGAISSNVVVASPASTSPLLTLERDNKGHFLRVPPSDALQGIILARLVRDDGCRSATVLALNNPYGVGLGQVFADTFRSLGGTVANVVRFDENAQSFSSEVQRAAQDGSDALVVVAYPGQGTPIMKEAFQRGAMQRSVVFFSEGVKDVKFVTDTGKTAAGAFVLAGLRGTAPGSVTTPGFEHFNRSFSQRHGSAPGLFAPEAYDAAWIVALAAQCAGQSTGAGIRANMLKVVNRDLPSDVAVSGANASLALTSARLPGCNINYQGASHDFDFSEKGEPRDGVYTVWRVTPQGTIETIRENLRP